MRSVPSASTLAVYSGASKLTATWPGTKLYIVWFDVFDNSLQVLPSLRSQESEARIHLMGVLAEMINTRGVEAACSAFDAKHGITLLQQQLS